MQVDPKTYSVCLIGLVAAGSVYLNLATWNRWRDQEHKELLTAIIVYGTIATMIGLLAVAVWTH
jgi:uncharacterized membrane protein